MAPRVSFVIRCRDYARFVGLAIESLLGQTFTDLEVIAIDDGSTDDSAAVLERFSADPRVRVVRHERNRGHIQTGNEGLGLARGEIVGLFDADDLCLRTDAVARQMSVFDANPDVGLVYSAQTYIDESGLPFRSVRPFARDHVRDGFAEFADLARRNYVAVSGTLFRRAALDAAGGALDADLPHSADWALWLRIAARFEVAYIADSLYAYRIHGNNLSVVHSPRAANGEIVIAVSRGFDALPEDAPRALRASRREVIHTVLLATHWGDRGLGRVRRSWQGLIDAALRAPGLLVTRRFYGAAARTAVLTALGHARYQRLVNMRHGAGTR
jgi:glycosyltransferase involved in cell wall biosynthesis